VTGNREDERHIIEMVMAGNQGGARGIWRGKGEEEIPHLQTQYLM